MVHLLNDFWAHNPAGVVLFDLVWLALAWRWARRPWLRAVLAAFFVGQMAVFLVTRTPSQVVPRVPRWAADAERIWNWTGPLLTIALGGVRLAAWFVRRWGPSERPADPSRRNFLRTGAVVAPMIVVGGLDVIALREGLRTRTRTLTFPGLPRHLDGMTLVQLSDLHVGPYTSPAVLEAMVQRVNALRADLIVVTGDWINRDLADLPTALGLLRRIESRFGMCGIEGNHDLLDNEVEFRRQVQAAGIPLLRDDTQVVEVRGGPLQLLGIRWGGRNLSENGETPAGTPGSVARVTRRRLDGVFPILLAHHPHAFDPAAAAGLPLTLAGHTHGGQVMITDQIGIGPRLFRYWSGWYGKGGSQLFVSNGIGNFFPLRVQAPAEIVALTLRKAPDGASVGL